MSTCQVYLSCIVVWSTCLVYMSCLLAVSVCLHLLSSVQQRLVEISLFLGSLQLRPVLFTHSQPPILKTLELFHIVDLSVFDRTSFLTWDVFQRVSLSLDVRSESDHLPGPGLGTDTFDDAVLVTGDKAVVAAVDRHFTLLKDWLKLFSWSHSF